MESPWNFIFCSIGTATLVMFLVAQMIKMMPTIVAVTLLQVGRNIHHIAQVGVIQVEDHLVWMHFLAEIAGYHSSVTEVVNIN